MNKMNKQNRNRLSYVYGNRLTAVRREGSLGSWVKKVKGLSKKPLRDTGNNMVITRRKVEWGQAERRG